VSESRQSTHSAANQRIHITSTLYRLNILAIYPIVYTENRSARRASSETSFEITGIVTFDMPAIRPIIPALKNAGQTDRKQQNWRKHNENAW